MFPFKGNTSVEVFSNVSDLPLVLTGYSVVNKTGGSVTVNIYLISGAAQICISPLNQVLTVGQMIESTNQVVILASEQIKLKPSGNVDYNFTLDNTTAP